MIGKWGLGTPGTTGEPDKKGSSTPSASSIIVTPIGNTPIICGATARGSRPISIATT